MAASKSGSGTGLAAGSAATILDWTGFSAKATRLVVRAVGDATFRLSVLISPDNGTAFAVGKQAASGTVVVDGGTTGYVNAAELDIVPSSEMKIQVWAVGGTLAYYYDVRIEMP